MASDHDFYFDVDGDGPETLAQRAARRARRKAGGLGLKDGSLAAARRQLEAMRDALSGAHMEILRLLEAQDAMNADDNQELSSAAAVRKSLLDRLDGIVRKVSTASLAKSSAPVAAGGGAETVAYYRDREWRRLRTLQ